MQARIKQKYVQRLKALLLKEKSMDKEGSSWSVFKQKKLAGLRRAIEEGATDAPIMELLDTINELANYATTSSCSGRLLLLAIKEHKKMPICTRNGMSCPA